MMVACMSDISIGYGSPQLVHMTRSLHGLLGRADDRPLILETDQAVRPPVHGLFPDVEVLRLATRFDVFHRSQHGKIDYVRQCARVLNDRRPDVLLLSNSFCLPVLWLLDYRPRLTILYMLEMPEAFGPSREESRINLSARDRLDLVIYPEHHRAKAHLNAFGYHAKPHVLIYNASPTAAEPPKPASERNGRFLHQGTVQRGLTGGEFYLDEMVQRLPIDLYGLIEGGDPVFRRAITQLGRGVRYRGYVDSKALAALRRDYAWTIVYWAPDSPNTRYACPNKFFESIAAGIPVVTAPHPQTRMLVEQYGCGVILDDWSLSAFVRGLTKARDLIGSSKYVEMVRRCEWAHALELNWDAQFARVARKLRAMGVGVAPRSAAEEDVVRPQLTQPMAQEAAALHVSARKT